MTPRELAVRHAEIAELGLEGWRQRQLERRRGDDQPLAKLTRAISETVAAVRNSIFGPPITFNRSRRKFLKDAIFTSAAAVPAIGLGLKLFRESKDRQEVKARVDEILAEPGDLEALPAGALIPEDERIGSDIMIALNPEYSFIPMYGYDFKAELDEFAGPVISAIEAETTVHVTVPTDTREEFLKLAKERYPALNFVVYEMPVNPIHGYMQDTLFATGSKNGGRFVTASSTLDMNEFKNLPSYEPPQEPFINEDKIRHMLADQNIRMQAIAGIGLLGDEMLVRDNPNAFESHRVPVKLEGGDIDSVRLPNGKVALMVGPWNIINSIVELANEEAGRKIYTSNAVEGFSVMPQDVFMRFFEQLKENYRKYLGVSDVIFVDEENIRSLIQEYEGISLGSLFSQKFFHTDMVVKVATDGDGKPVAFCTLCDNADPMDVYYLTRVRAQFESLGYEVVYLPCGPFPTMNYTNSLMYTKDGEKVVMMPTYGISEDEVAAKVYTERGFRVVKAYLSNIKDLDPSKLDNLGSVHCRAEILA